MNTDTDGNLAALRQQEMTKEEWQQRIADARVYDHLPENKREIARLKELGEQRGWTGRSLTSTRWASYQCDLVHRLVRERKKLYGRSGEVVLTLDDVIDRAMTGQGREWLKDAYLCLIDGRQGSAIDKMEQAIRCAAMELVISFRDQLDIEEKRSAA